LEELVGEGNEEGGDDELDDEEEADAGAEVFGLAAETREDVDGGLTQGYDECEDYCQSASVHEQTTRGEERNDTHASEPH
jgi:hypothetical protein